MKIHVAAALAVFALTPVAAIAETQEEQQACMDDAFNVCGDAIPDRGRVAACLAHNINRISSACRTVMMRYQQPAPAVVRAPSQSKKGQKTTNGQKATKGPLNIKPASTRAASRS